MLERGEKKKRRKYKIELITTQPAQLFCNMIPIRKARKKERKVAKCPVNLPCAESI